MSYSDKKMQSDFLKTIKAQSTNKTTAYDTTATVTRVDSDGTAWVHIPGGVDETPCEMTISCSEGDSVKVRVSGGRCYTIGNVTSPPTDDSSLTEVSETITKKIETVREAMEIEAESLSLRVLGAEEDSASALQKATEVEATTDGITTRVSEIEGDYQKASTMEQTVKGFTWTVTGDDLAAVEETAEDAESDAASALSTANSAYSNASTALSTASDAKKVATNYLNFSSAGLVVGDMTSSTLGKNVLIDSDSVDIRNGSTTLASFGADSIYIGKNSESARIDMCGDQLSIYSTSPSGSATHQAIVSQKPLFIGGGSNEICFGNSSSDRALIMKLVPSGYWNIGGQVTLTAQDFYFNSSSFNFEGSTVKIKGTTINMEADTNITGDLDATGYTQSGSPIATTKSVTITGTIAATDGKQLSTTFTMPSPYRKVTGIRQISNNHGQVCSLNAFSVNGDGATGNTVTVSLTFYNRSSSSQSMSCTVELGLSV